jgi:hypothetical protein
MAPIGDDVAQKILDSIQDLQSRIKKLEDGIQHKAGGGPPPATEGIRMILMGPPGAGMSMFLSFQESIRLIRIKQAREPKLRRSRRDFHAVIWYVNRSFYTQNRDI